jgi:lysyl-tRNA synthetase class II
LDATFLAASLFAHFMSAAQRFDSLNSGAVFEKLIEPTLIQPTFITHR